VNILILGSLGPNEDRILALKRLGHTLVYGYVDFTPAVPILAADITCIALARRSLPRQVSYLVDQHAINVGYCLLNHHDESTDVALELIDAAVDLPLVRHYKEHAATPDHHERRMLLETDGQIYINRQSLEHFRALYGVPSWSAHIMDGDLIAARYMTDDFSPKLRHRDNEPHLLVVGNVAMSNNRQDMRELCEAMHNRHVHVHLYGNYVGTDAQGRHVVGHQPTRRVYERMTRALRYVHLHPYIERDTFTREWSRYDAGMMHVPSHPAAAYAQFEQMNYPYRYSAYLAAGLPLAVMHEGQDAMKALVQQHGIGVVYRDYDDLAEQLRDAQHMARLDDAARTNRTAFSFDAQAPHLADILQQYARGAH